ncbi:MAG: hypothetical protein AAF901_08125 [Bacteroidota bacterium]
MIKTAHVLPFILCFTYLTAQEYKVKSLDINNKLDHHAPVMVGDTIYFSCNLTDKRGQPILDKYSEKVFGLYKASTTSDGEIEDPEVIKKTERRKFNMTGATFSKDGKYMYFTSNNYHLGNNKSERHKMYNLVIRRAEYDDDKGWTNFTTLPFCDTDYNYGHPALSADDSTLYFVSNMEGTKGKSDLYRVIVKRHQTYGEIERLNKYINSPRTELFPFVSSDNVLYFASNREGGYGALDIYKYDLSKAGASTEPELLPEPINSKGNDFSFCIFDDSKRGYFASRRRRGKGGDDLFYFTVE